MAKLRDESGHLYCLMECPHCENHDWHAQVEDRELVGDREVFQCALCFAIFTYFP